MNRFLLVFAVFLLVSGIARAEDVTVRMYLTTNTGNGELIGTISLNETPYGVLFIPDLEGLSQGLHGFHVHENPNCGPGDKDGKMVPGLAAGGHYDPDKTGRHAGPYGDGHLGDLPPLYVDAGGKTPLSVLAPRLKAADLMGRSLVIHAGADNFSDSPEKLGGGGPRKACGVVN